ncbi:TetR family transcriptional regulator [Mycolicibacterium insubricum]|jgi:hypothetical protein|nr:TetR family transcriptional regulator [Mycolicibacterium insubricum]
MSQNGAMPDRSTTPGLRERKKMRTRETIRREAFRLFDAQGFGATTVEQIAEASDISASTFFRYFPNKAALLIPNQLLNPIVDTFLAAPSELSPIGAYRFALAQVFGQFGGSDWSEEAARQALMYSLPEAAGALYLGYIETIEVITGALATRLSQSPDDPRLRITAGAITGVLMQSLHGAPMDPAPLLTALDFLDAGLPLT